MLFSNVLYNGITKNDQKLWVAVMDKLLKLNGSADKLAGDKRRIRYECHSICQAVKWAVPELTLTHGRYLGIDLFKKEENYEYDIRNCRHSWLKTPDDTIIDPYPVGFLTVNPVIIGKSDFGCFGRAFYFEQPDVIREIKYREIWKKARRMYELM